MSLESESEILGSLERVEMEVEELQERLDYLSTKRDKVQQELEHIMDSVQDVLKQKKDQLVDTLNDLFTAESRRISIDIRDKQNLAAETKKELEQVKEMSRSNSQDDRNRLSRSIELRYKRQQPTYNEDKPRLLDMNLDINFTDLMNSVEQIVFGEIDAVYDSRGKSTLERFPSSPSFAPTDTDCGDNSFTGKMPTTIIHSRVNRDQMEPKLDDIVVVDTVETVAIVVTDKSNRSIKSFYTKKDHSCYSLEKTATQPRGITRVGSGKVGVTLPESKSIKILKVTPALKRDKEIKTLKRYRGIGMLDFERLVVSTYETFPGSVDIIDFKGNILQSMESDRTGSRMFDYSFYLTTVQGEIIISDCERQTVTCITDTGEVLFQYTNGGEVNVKYPLGVALNTFGDILVADCDGHKIVKIRRGGQGAKVVLRKEDGIIGPYSVDVDVHGNIYVAQWNGDIKVFSDQ